MKKDGRDLLAHVRRLAAPRPLISIQRWNFARIALALAVLVASAMALLLTFFARNLVRNADVLTAPNCEPSDVTVPGG